MALMVAALPMVWRTAVLARFLWQEHRDIP
jgi:hypothetical protein